MSILPFFVRRVWLMTSQWLTDRDRPDLERLRSTKDPERFLWAILPHAARTFGSCILLLPRDKAYAAAVGYLYCRTLDTYEDLAADPTPLLQSFGNRFDTHRLPAPPLLVEPQVQDIRDRAHLVLVECLNRVDTVYAGLEQRHQESIARCVSDMAIGMQQRPADGAGVGNFVGGRVGLALGEADGLADGAAVLSQHARYSPLACGQQRRSPSPSPPVPAAPVSAWCPTSSSLTVQPSYVPQKSF